VKELKRGGSGSANLSKEDKLAKQLMLPRMNKNSKQILVQKKKVGGPVFQKYDVKHGVTNIKEKEEETSKKLTPVRPITPKGMIRDKKRSRNDMMKGMFYSRKDLISKKNNDYRSKEGKQGGFQREDETKEEMMYRILKNKGKGIKNTREKNEDDDDMEQERDYPEDRRDIEMYKNKFYKQKEKMYETPIQKDPMDIRMVRKSNSMLPPKGGFLPQEKSPRGYGRESDLMGTPPKEDSSSKYKNYKNQHKKNASNMYYLEPHRDSPESQKRSDKKSSSMKPNKVEIEDPFKDFIEREKKYDKDILRDMLELEDMFTQDYSRHIDSMVGLVKKDIAIQASIREEKGPMKFEESISRVKKILQSKKDSLDKIMSAINRFEVKFGNLKQRKEKMKNAMKTEPQSIRYTKPSSNVRKESEPMRPQRNMQGGMAMGNSKSMYGIGMNPTLKPLNMNPQKQMKYEYQYQGFGRGRNGQNQDLSDKKHKAKNMMMMGMKPMGFKDRYKQMTNSKKELKPITKDSGKQKFSMLPNMKLQQRTVDDEDTREKTPRARTDTEVTKDLMNDLDLDNDLSLI
jgi:hypothetical protein